MKNVKHFETLWEESEKLSEEIKKNHDLESVINLVKEEIDITLNSKTPDERAESIGRMLFYISAISNKENINVYAALESAMSDLKIEFYELEEDV